MFALTTSHFVCMASMLLPAKWVIVNSFKPGSLLNEPFSYPDVILETGGLPVPDPCFEGQFHWNGGCYPCSRYCFKQKCDTWTGVCTYGQCEDGSRYFEDFRCLRTCSVGWYGENCGRPCGKCLLDTCHPKFGLCYKGDELGYSLSDDYFKDIDLNEHFSEASWTRYHGWCEHMIEITPSLQVRMATPSDPFVLHGKTIVNVSNHSLWNGPPKLEGLAVGYNYRGSRCEFRSGCDGWHFGTRCERNCTLCGGYQCNDYAVCTDGTCPWGKELGWIKKSIYGAMRCRSAACYPEEIGMYFIPIPREIVNYNKNTNQEDTRRNTTLGRCFNKCGHCFRRVCEPVYGNCSAGCEMNWTGRTCNVYNGTQVNVLIEEEIAVFPDPPDPEPSDEPDMTPAELLQSIVIVCIALLLPFLSTIICFYFIKYSDIDDSTYGILNTDVLGLLEE